MLNNRTLQAFLAIGPILLLTMILIGYFFFIFSFVFNAEQMNNDQPPIAFLGGFAIFIIGFFLYMILSLLSLIYFVIHAAKNPNLEAGSSRVLWILIIVLVSGIGNLIYWIAEIQIKNPKPVITD